MSTDLDRRIQIEDIWTRRIIMEPIRNIERRAEFEAVKQLWRCFPQDRPEYITTVSPGNVYPSRSGFTITSGTFGPITLPRPENVYWLHTP